MEVSINGGTPKSSISMAFSIIKHPFWGNPISGNLRISYAYLQMNFELPIGTEAIICSFCRKEVEIKSAPKNLNGFVPNISVAINLSDVSIYTQG